MPKQMVIRLKTIGWCVLGFGMLHVTYSEYQSWLNTGIVALRREGIRISGEGAIPVLFALLGLAAIFFALAFATWRSK